jgi:hypothetical protein
MLEIAGVIDEIDRTPIHGVVATVLYLDAARLARIPRLGPAQTVSNALILSKAPRSGRTSKRGPGGKSRKKQGL